MTDWLDDIEARATAATDGPWASAWDDDDDPEMAPHDVSSVYSVAPIPEDKRPVCSVMWWDGHMSACTEPDAAFIAHAREDVPRMAALIRRYRRVMHAMAHGAGVDSECDCTPATVLDDAESDTFGVEPPRQ